ncbi:V0/A0 complex, 116-kDa subunit of ATPase [Basidiobolus meristosporus CBS 931.73]|uniref:V-type proton ATPase subunit a n=1 Tax=Basidiobolus meristosporus CBS 931.73 TaxID=1314790 RepID=A0A1Y1YU27_9FUNG|nr:V0/A0 complex, 116-kDa subunit of ATPase [Basidiobolus meristosporus CBS 931.73]|eukprot:ORY01540.1 V0/A0 complex, 116-kDa subunit of ATPase [Basidiobolus meristosporus CBS 931.73]
MARSTLFRSEEMSLVQLFIPTEISHSTVAHLGERGLIQFRDLNPDLSFFQRSFSDEIRRLNDIERQLRNFSEQCESSNIKIPHMNADSTGTNQPITGRDIHDLAEQLSEHEDKLSNFNDSYRALQRQHQELIENKYVLEGSANIQDIGSLQCPAPAQDQPDSDVETGKTELNQSVSSVGFVAGTIPRNKINVFERVLWRSLRGNLYMYQSEIPEPLTDWQSGDQLEKSTFVIYAHGSEILSKIRKIAEAMGASLYPIDINPEQRRLKIRDIESRLSDLRNILENTNQTRRSELELIARNLSEWMTLVKKEKAIYHVMNLFNYDQNRRCLIAEGWCPTNDIPSAQLSLREAAESTGSHVYPILTQLQTKREPPTFHRTNKFSQGFQNIVDAYGVAKYQEVNPGLFTVITFPFLFAVMFGDLGHGVLMTAFALWLVLKEKSLARYNGGEIFAMMFNGRYIILLMGLFSIFTGLIYNDLFSRSLAIFPSGWAWPAATQNGQSIDARPVGVYPFGLDSAWHGTDNYLIFTNSYKMKMSVILGVIQMSVGIILTIYNHVHFRHGYAIWAEFLPQILFMECIFGYLCICIIYKWLINWNNQPISPPSLLNMLIYMFLSPGSVSPKDQLYSGQGTIQLVLIFIAVVCIPWMLLTKPFILKYKHSKKDRSAPAEILVNSEETGLSSDEDKLKPNHENPEGSKDPGRIPEDSKNDHEIFEFGDIMIHQVIHTIEFCLGCISNTASYLRLWALSLAHAQLSSVLWDMTLKIVLGLAFPINIIGIWAGFAVWFALTVSILMVMEGLSAFLHALRLHWVEFNNKFYAGTGYKYTPFNFRSILRNEDAD